MDYFWLKNLKKELKKIAARDTLHLFNLAREQKKV
jgi:hypothetical protein